VVRSFRFVLSRRWLLFAVAIVLVGYATWWLGEWQFHRLEDRKASNQVVQHNEDVPPTPVADVLAVDRAVDEVDEWRIVSATGRYAVEDTVIVRYRTRDGASGVDVVVPLVTADGTALLVDRGWLQTDNRGADQADVPVPPSGEVDVTGWVRADGTGDSTEVTDQSVRAISSVAIGDALDRRVYGGFVELRSEDPEPVTSLEQVELPELDNGPHFFYGLQWWFFGVLAVFGFFYLMYDEWRNGARGDREGRALPKRSATARRHKERSIPPSTGSIAPDTNDDAGDSRKAAARPNSPGSP
jgi:cytochrome oxidase assembly protein ShyY1